MNPCSLSGLLNSDGYLDFNTHSFNGTLVNAVKEPNTKCDQLSEENDELKARLERLEAILAAGK